METPDALYIVLGGPLYFPAGLPSISFLLILPGPLSFLDLIPKSFVSDAVICQINAILPYTSF